MSGGGPPERYTVEQVAFALEQTAAIYSAAGEKLGCTGQTVSNYVNRYPELQTKVAEIMESRLDLAESQLVVLLKEGSERSVHFYLRTKGKQRGYTEKTELGGPGGGPVPVAISAAAYDYTKLDEEELVQLETLLAKARPDDAA